MGIGGERHPQGGCGREGRWSLPPEFSMEIMYDPSRGQLHPCWSPQMGPRCVFMATGGCGTIPGHLLLLGGHKGRLCPPSLPSPEIEKEGG